MINYTTEVVVVGAGIIGMSTALALVDRGVNVICVEQGMPGSGQSRGVVRNFRHYHASIEMIHRASLARDGWKLWEERFNRPLLKEVGLITLSRRSQHIAERLQHCKVPVTLDQTGGVIRGLPTHRHWDAALVVDEKAGPISAGIAIDVLYGALADKIMNATVLALQSYQDHVEVATTEGIIHTDYVIVCAGTQTDRIALSAGINIDIVRALHPRPCYLIKDPFRGSELKAVIDESGLFGPSIYGSPTPDGQHYVIGLAGVGEDTPVQADSEYSVDLAAVDSDIRKINDYVRAAFTGLDSHPVSARLCTTTALPGEDGDTIACYKRDRLSFVVGNNLFKFAPLLGPELAETAMSNGSDWLVRLA
jgi:glycine/D-amino acid oxidase-like deaminating enzyme